MTNTTQQLEHVTAGGEGGYQSEKWERLYSAQDAKEYSIAWLEILCKTVSNVHQGVVIYGNSERGPFAPVAIWPQDASGNPTFAKLVETSINNRQTIIQNAKTAQGKQEYSYVVYPLLVDGKLFGSTALEINSTSDEELSTALEQLKWGSSWLELLVRRKKLTPNDRLITVLELIATGLHNERFQGSATSIATELAGILVCERVSIGFLRGKHSQVRALSHSASFSKKANIIRAIEACMDEAIDQQATVIYPPQEDGPIQVIKAHEELCKKHGAGAAYTIPLTEGEKLIGAMVLEFPEGTSPDSNAIKLSEHVATLIGPILDVKRKDDQWLIKKAYDSFKHHAKKLFGPRHTGFKLATISILAVIAFFTFHTSDFRITADATLEGSIQRVVAAPMAGYVVEANYRAGDIVKEGDVLFSLDDRDLRLEHLKWVSQKTQRTREYSEAQAKHDRAKARILGAQIQQADAQIALVEEQLNRVHAKAPFSGFIVSGDLSQSLGAPVERGDALFQVAPLSDYRVILNVDEKEIGYLSTEQTGTLVLTGLPDEPVAIQVEKITPISAAEEGGNFFRVEATIQEDASPKLRPGMEGVGKIYIDERKTIWIWTYKITHWFKMFFWSWWP